MSINLIKNIFSRNVPNVCESIIEYIHGPIKTKNNDINLIFNFEMKLNIGDIDIFSQFQFIFPQFQFIFNNKEYIIFRPPNKPEPHPLTKKNSLYVFWENRGNINEYTPYYKEVRDYTIYVFSQIEGLQYIDKKINIYRQYIGLDLIYKNKKFSLVWENPNYYMGMFAEIMCPNSIVERLELDDFPNILKYLDRNI
jgi:hypothetical protein